MNRSAAQIHSRVLLPLLAAVLLMAGASLDARPAAAEIASGWARTDQVSVRLVSAASGAGASREVRLGLEFRMEPGWKIYWRSPGDAGFPPSIDWRESENVANLDMRWPAPHRFEILGLTTLGYEDEVVLPLAVTVARPGEAVRLVAHVRYMTCKEVCIPYDATLRLTLPAGPAQSTLYTHLIDSYANRVPGDGNRAGLSVEQVALRRRGTERFLEVTAAAEAGFNDPDLAVEGPPAARFGAPDVTLSQGARRARFLVPVSVDADSAGIAGEPLTLTLLDGFQNAEFVRSAETGAPLSADAGAPWWSILLIAFVGGLILNLMPCVLPVLSLKVAGVIGLGGAARGLIRRKFAATAAGIVASFLALAGFLIGLRAGGASIGWGIQFQEPLFLVAMTVILTLFAANLLGLFTLRLPAALSAALAGGPERKGLTGDFLTGAFATLLATPCSAPFVGTAVGFALAGPADRILAIFAVMGVGLATPYLLVGLFPSVAAKLPKPGRWMNRLEILLGALLLGTVVWLVSVLWAQLGPAAYYIAALIGGILIILAAARYLLPRHAVRARGAIAGVLVLALAGGAFAVPVEFAARGPGTSFVYGDYWRPWDRDAINDHVQAGQVVFVDVTAEWCITCQVNKRLVLGRGAVQDRLAGDGIVPMVADWTRPDPAIADYLASFGRYGIPFNVVYGPAAPEGIVLPEILTTDAVLSAIRRASGRTAAER